MLCEPSTLASIAYVLGRTLDRDYGIDPAPVFALANIEHQASFEAGERISVERMHELWHAATIATNDGLFGIKMGRNIEPSYFYAFGHSWLASETLLGAMRRLCRYDKIISTLPASLDIRQDNGSYVLTESYPDPTMLPSKESIDFGVSAVLRLCEISAGRTIRPSRVELMFTDISQTESYCAAFDTPVQLRSRNTAVYFSRDDLECPLPGSIPEVAKATDRISEQYIETLDSRKVATKVRQLLIDFLPSGNSHQNRVAQSLHRSASTLQRQLQSEGTNFREVLRDTRRSLSQEYLRDSKYSHAQIAYLLGFSDQSNFSRAFKRWTGVTPRNFQTSLKSL